MTETADKAAAASALCRKRSKTVFLTFAGLALAGFALGFVASPFI